MSNSKFMSGCVSVPVLDKMRNNLSHVAKANGQYCWLCGGPHGEQAVLVKKAVGDTFTDWAFVARPKETHLCLDCAVWLTSRISVDKQDGSRSNGVHIRILGFWGNESGDTYPKFRVEGDQVIASDLLSPSVWRSIYLDGWKGLALCLHPLSGQKHLFFRQARPCSMHQLMIQRDESLLCCGRQSLLDAHRLIEPLYRLGETKAAILSGEYKTFSKDAIQMQKHLDASKLRGGSILPLALSIATKENEETNESN